MAFLMILAGTACAAVSLLPSSTSPHHLSPVLGRITISEHLLRTYLYLARPRKTVLQIIASSDQSTVRAQ